jgi:formyltetrahydrofolate synthetase
VAVSEHWLKGGEGAPSNWPRPSSPPAHEKKRLPLPLRAWTPLRQRIELIATEVYGADGVTYTTEARPSSAALEADPATAAWAPAWSRPT